MISVNVLYPNKPGARFDLDYYLGQHIPMVRRLLGAACKTIAVERGAGGAEPGSPPAYAAMGRLYFESAEAFFAAFGPHASVISRDITNYTDIQPLIQINEVAL